MSDFASLIICFIIDCGSDPKSLARSDSALLRTTLSPLLIDISDSIDALSSDSFCKLPIMPCCTSGLRCGGVGGNGDVGTSNLKPSLITLTV